MFFFKHTTPACIYTLSLHDALPISFDIPDLFGYHGNELRYYDELWGGKNEWRNLGVLPLWDAEVSPLILARSEEHTSELQSRRELVCRLLLEKKNTVPRHLVLATVT